MENNNNNNNMRAVTGTEHEVEGAIINSRWWSVGMV